MSRSLGASGRLTPRNYFELVASNGRPRREGDRRHVMDTSQMDGISSAAPVANLNGLAYEEVCS